MALLPSHLNSPSDTRSSSVGSRAGSNQPEIVTIPEKFYGVALKLQAPVETPPIVQKPLPPPASAKKPTSASSLALPKHPYLPFVLGALGLLVLLLGGLGFVFRDRLIRPADPVVPPVVVVVVPSAPSGLVASSTSHQSVSLTWQDTSGNESAFRIERKEGDAGTFIPVTNLPANSQAFLDVSVLASRVYAYRVFAVNDGGDSPATSDASVATGPAPVLATSGPLLPPGGLDLDSDGLSDVEEPLYGTDSQDPDADDDGFLDGNEVFHLYNPAAQAPVRLVDSGLVTAFAPSIGWQMYIPKTWKAILKTPDGSSVSLVTGSGETINIRVEENARKQRAMDWYLSSHPGIVSTELRFFQTKGKLEGVLGKDRLSAIFAWDDHLLEIQYDLGSQTYVNYRTTFEMMLNSLRLGSAPVIYSTDLSGGPGTLLGVSTSTGMQTVRTATSTDDGTQTSTSTGLTP